MPDKRRGFAPSGDQEWFNHLDSSIRNVVEHSFGVRKMKWRIFLKIMSSYPMEKQRMILVAITCLHNFIHENHLEDKYFRKYNRNPDCVPTIPLRYRNPFGAHNTSDMITPESNDQDMDKFQDDLARAIYLSRSSTTYIFVHIMTLHSYFCFSVSFLCKKTH